LAQLTQDTPPWMVAGVARVEDIHKHDHAVVDLDGETGAVSDDTSSFSFCKPKRAEVCPTCSSLGID
jgi:hypothetical protein